MTRRVVDRDDFASSRSKFEYRCVRPGEWQIEGVTVRRIGRRWEGELTDGSPFSARTLTEAFEIIGDDIF